MPGETKTSVKKLLYILFSIFLIDISTIATVIFRRFIGAINVGTWTSQYMNDTKMIFLKFVLGIYISQLYNIKHEEHTEIHKARDIIIWS